MLDSSAALPSSSSLLQVLATASLVNAAYLVKSFRLDCLLFGCWFSPSYTTRSGGRWRRRGKNHGTRSCLQTRHPDERTNQVRKLPHILSLYLSFFVTTYGCSRIQWPVFATSCVCSEPFSWLLATWICRESVSRHKSDNGLCIYVSVSICVQHISASASVSLGSNLWAFFVLRKARMSQMDSENTSHDQIREETKRNPVKAIRSDKQTNKQSYTCGCGVPIESMEPGEMGGWGIMTTVTTANPYMYITHPCTSTCGKAHHLTWRKPGVSMLLPQITAKSFILLLMSVVDGQIQESIICCCCCGWC